MLQFKRCFLKLARSLRPRGRCLALAALVLFCLQTQPGLAQDNDGWKKNVSMGGIVVTATKTDTEAEKVATNLTIITREEIEKHPGCVDILDLLRDLQIPGLYIATLPNSLPVDGQISSRGGEISAWGMRVLVNGVEFNKGNGYIVPARMPFHDIERIEIIRTPSAEYGDQAVGGVINIITRVADKPLEGKIGLGGGGFGSYDGYAVLNGSSGAVEYFLDVSINRWEGYQDRVFENDNTLYGRFNWDINDTTSLTWHGSYFDSLGNYGNKMTREQFEDDPTQNPGNDQKLDDTYWITALVLNKQFGNNEFSFKTEFKDELTKMFWGSGYYEYDEWEVHPELKFISRHHLGDMDNKFVIGTEFRYHEIGTSMFSAESGAIVGDQFGDLFRKDTTWAAFVQDELSLTPALTLTLGLRYDFFHQEQENKINPSAGWEQENSAFSPKVGLTYEVNQGLNLFAGLNSGFKSPARVSAAAASGELDPERTYATEVGLRGRPLSWLSYDVAFFWHEVLDKFVKPSKEADAVYENAGKTRALGVEMELKARFENGLYASASFTYQESKFIDFVSNDVDYGDNYLSGVPKTLGGATLGYRDPVFGDLSLSLSYIGERWFNYANDLHEDGFVVLNARYRKKFDNIYPGLAFYINAYNLTDESVATYVSGTADNEYVYPYPGFSICGGITIDF